MKFFIPFLFLLTCLGCHSANQPAISHVDSMAIVKQYMAKVKKGMKPEEIKSLIGEPTSTEDLGSVISVDTVHLVKWSFGDNMELMFVNDTLSSIDTNVMLSQQRLQHIIDSARQAEKKTQPFTIKSR